jgi:endoglucanase
MGQEKMKSLLSCYFLSLCGTVTMLAASVATCQPVQAVRGEVEVQGKELLRDGRRWIPHGFYQIAFEVAPGNLGRADHPFWATAYNKYTPEEYVEMRKSGADSVRLQVAQAGADPQSKLFDRAFLDKAMGAIRAARAAGLTVIVCVQDESHVPGDKPIDLPDGGTRRVWKEIAPQFANDRGVLFEILNEPRPAPNPQNWKRWKAAMTETIQTVRETGARNVVIADGLGVGQVIDGAPLLHDSQVAYASHPYALKKSGKYDQTSKAWDAKFGNFSGRAPVIITEWLSGAYFCNADTPESTVKFVQYLQEHGIGLEVGIWDWAPEGFGSARQGFPNSTVSSFNDHSCYQPGYGLGRVVQTWYTTGVPANTPK